MKSKNIFLRSLSLAVFFMMAVVVQAQDKKDKDAVLKNIVEAKTYIFIAQTAQPTTGRVRQLTTEYILDINADTISADLPYFGRAYTAPIDASKGGIHFTSTDFEYTAKPKKKGGWSILIKPKQNPDASQLSLDISSSGYANLQVISNSRQSISFSGYIAERKIK